MILIPKKHNRYYAQKKASIQKDESHFIIGRIKNYSAFASSVAGASATGAASSV